MADPTARFVLTASDQTAAAFRSADKNLKQFQRSANSIKQLLGTFGVVFSARAFAGWISGALEAKEMTEEQLSATKQAREALAGMKAASDELARSLATSLVPAMQGVSAVLTGWNRILTNADPFPFEQQIVTLEGHVGRLRASIESASPGQPWVEDFKRKLAEAEAQLESLQQKQRAALGMDMSALTGIDTGFKDNDELVATETMLANLFRDVEKQRSDLLRRTAAEETATETMLFNLFRDIEAEKVKLREEEFDTMWRNLQAELEIYDEIAAKATESAEESESAFASFAQAAGLGIRDSLVDAFMGVETSFRDLLKRMLAEFAVSGLFEAFATLAGGGAGVGAKFFSGLFGGSRAMTGPVEAGKIYKVHRGEAFFAPGEDGRVGRMRDGGGGISVVNNYDIDARGATTDLVQSLPKILEEHSKRTKAEIAELMRRGRFAPA